MNWLYGKNIVLTGASSGIGKDLVKILTSKYMCNVVGIARSGDKLEALKQELNTPNFNFFVMDTSKKEKWQELRKYLFENNFQIDILINNAGRIHPFCAVKNLDIETTKNVIDVNFYSMVYGVDALIHDILKSDTPSIVNICSSSALCPVVGTAGYCASKSAMKAYSETLAIEMKNKAFVSTIFPGFTTTNIFDSKDNSQPVVQAKDRSLIDKISMPSIKMANKIVKTIKRKKRRKILGWDAKLMNFGYKVMPQKTPAIINWVFKKSKKETFKGIYE